MTETELSAIRAKAGKPAPGKESKLFSYASRTDDTLNGGDIDLL